MTMADTVPTLPAALTQGRKIACGPKVTPGIPPEAVPPFRLGRGHLQFSLVPVRGRFISAQRMAAVSIHREQVMISGAQPTANHRRQLLEGLSVSSQNPQSNPTHLLSETINSKLQLTIDERRHPLMSRGLPALVFGWLLSRYVGTHSALWHPQ